MYSIYDILSMACFPEDARAYFDDVYCSVNATPSLLSLLGDACRSYLQKESCEAQLDALAAGAKIHRYSADMLMLLQASCTLGLLYKEKGYSEVLLQETLQDLRYKLEECLTVYGIYGTFVLPWFDRFFDCTRFKLGRLQYETTVLDEEYPGFTKKGDRVLNCHIPSSGPLTMEEVTASLDMAYAFFGYQKPMTVMCASWMLYPPHYPLFEEGSNLQKFYSLFQIADARSYGHNHDAWRIFGTNDPDLSHWPQKTTLQRNFHRYIGEGNVMGYGVGFLRYTPSSEESPKVENT